MAGPVFAFTLIELLVVIVIVAILVAISLPIFNSVIATKNTVACLSNLRQIGAASIAYCNDNNGYFPPCSSFPPYTTNSNSPWNKRLSSYLGLSSDTQATKLLKCPSDPRPYQIAGAAPNATPNYARSYSFNATAAFEGNGSASLTGLMQTTPAGSNVFPSRRIVQVTEPSQTIMVTEWWTSSSGALRDNWQDSYNYSVVSGFGTVNDVFKYTDGKTYYHGGGKNLNAVFVDGHAAGVTPVDLVGAKGTAGYTISPFTVLR